MNAAESIIARALAQAYYAGKRHGLECITGEQAAPVDEILVEDCATWFMPRAQVIWDDIAESLPVSGTPPRAMVIDLPAFKTAPPPDYDNDDDLAFDQADFEARR